MKSKTLGDTGITKITSGSLLIESVKLIYLQLAD